VPLWTGAGRHGRGLHDHVGVAGLQRVLEDVRVAYFDGDADLSSPERTRSGVLDATGVAHFLGIADTPLARIGRQVPMLAEHQLTLLGYDPSDPDSYDEAALVARPGLVHASDAELRADPVAMAQRAVNAVARDGARVVVHFDVDAVDSRDLALANFPALRHRSAFGVSRAGVTDTARSLRFGCARAN
jgi:arginase